MTKQPPWIARSRRDRQLMVNWLEVKLDKIFFDEFEKYQHEGLKNYDKVLAWAKKLGPEIAEAEHGNVEPLRRRFPVIAKYINLPRRHRGQRYPRREDVNKVGPLNAAAADISRIRAIWQEHYGKKNRPADQASAEEIAAELWDVKIEDLVKHLKKIPAK
jgi:hypothetical protein